MAAEIHQRKSSGEVDDAARAGRHQGGAASGPPTHLLVAEDLRKSYGPRTALRGLSFSLKPGRILGFLGPNGAGKTTAIRILTTILEPSSGSFSVDGISWRHPERIRHRIGVLPENLGFPKQMTGIEYLTYFGQLYGRSAGDARSRGQALLEDVGMQARARSLIGSYSHGMRQRLGIARALVNDPVVVFLDEPTLGLDPRGQQELLGLVRWIARERNAGVILCSHLLTEVEAVCDDVVILSSGEVVVAGSVADVVGRGRRSVVRSLVRIQVPQAKLAEAARALETTPGVARVTRSAPTESGAWLRVELDEAGDGDPGGVDRVSQRIRERLLGLEVPVLSLEAEAGRVEVVRLRIQVPERAVEEARRVLAATTHVTSVAPSGERAGWLTVEVVEPADAGSAGDGHVNNRLLESLIRAKIPVLALEAEGGRLQDAFLQLTAQAIK
jgi:ABC-2 type transport system ATP-binding protein